MTFISKTTLILLSPLAFVSCNKETAEVDSNTPATSDAAVKPYPLDVCIVSGEKLGSMGEPVAIVHEGQEIRAGFDGLHPAGNRPDLLEARHNLFVRALL